MNLKKIGKVLMSKFVGTGPSSYKKIIYRAMVSQRLRNTVIGQVVLSILKDNLGCLTLKMRTLHFSERSEAAQPAT